MGRNDCPVLRVVAIRQLINSYCISVSFAVSLLQMATTQTTRREKSNGQGQGMNWIRPEKRLAIYLRDGLACCYCGRGIEDEVKLTLDHLRPYSQGGTNNETNLVTCCFACNSSRGSRSWKVFAEKVAEYFSHGRTAGSIVAYIQRTRRRTLDVAAAKELIEQRGGFSAALTRGAI